MGEGGGGGDEGEERKGGGREEKGKLEKNRKDPTQTNNKSINLKILAIHT